MAEGKRVRPRNKPSVDHLGNHYDSESSMCAAYGIKPPVYRNRLKKGWTLEEALTRKKEKEAVFDHLGNPYPSIVVMCRHYGTSVPTFKKRLREGLSLEQALDANYNLVRKPGTDHLGNHYNSRREMCEAYGVRPDVFCQRLKRGWTLEESLTGKGKHPVTDHLGNSYPSKRVMAESYGLNQAYLAYRLKEGWSLEEALTTEKGYSPNRPPVIDHLGNTYTNLQAMCDAHGINRYTYLARRRAGRSLEAALQPLSSRCYNRVACQDHLGNKYDSKTEMAKKYGLTLGVFQGRINRGWTLEESLTGKGRHSVTDHLGNSYPSKKVMAESYGLSTVILYKRLKAGWSLEKALTTEKGYPLAPRKGLPVIDHLGNTYVSVKAMCDAHGINRYTYSSRRKAGRSLEAALQPPASRHHHGVACQDHLGNKYDSKTEMAKKYGLTLGVFQGRINRGWTLEESLTGKERHSVTDHLGNSYPSKKVMAESYGLSTMILYKRLKAGWSLEKALTTEKGYPLAPRKGLPAIDHLGNTYVSVKAMCDAHGIKMSTYSSRRRAGRSLEAALQPPSSRSRSRSRSRLRLRLRRRRRVACQDHLGNKYDSVTEMVKEYGVTLSAFRGRIKRGWTLEESLTRKEKRAVTDHLGNSYPTLNAMCESYGIVPTTVSRRILRGWSLEEALTTEKGGSRDRHKMPPVIDHLGNTYVSIKAMCDAHGIKMSTYLTRRKKGHSLEAALQPPASRYHNIIACQDHLGNKYDSMTEMAKKYGLNLQAFKIRINRGWTLEESLTGNKKSKAAVAVKDHLGNSYPSMQAMCESYGIALTTVSSRITRGRSLEEALTTPVRARRRN